MPDFYALIRPDSKYTGQDGGKPFAVSLAHSSDGYIWEGDPGRYRVADLLLLVPSEPPLKEAEPVLVFDESDSVPEDSSEEERRYQKSLAESEWFRPMSNQPAKAWFQCVNRDGKTHQ